jgi:hypothetical protein
MGLGCMTRNSMNLDGRPEEKVTRDTEMHYKLPFTFFFPIDKAISIPLNRRCRCMLQEGSLYASICWLGRGAMI